MEDRLAICVLKRFEMLRSARAPYEGEWRDIRDLVWPYVTDFSGTVVPGRRRSEKIYDGTAPKAMEELASGLHSYLTNPVEPWFSIGINGMQRDEYDDEAKLWLEQVIDVMMYEYSNEDVALQAALHEVYMGLAFGSTVLNQEWDKETGHLLFRALPISTCYIDENHRGQVDVLFRILTMSTDQLKNKFSGEEDRIPDNVMRDKENKCKWHVIHAVYPREMTGMLCMTNRRMKFASVWVIEDGASVLRESGYSSFPFHVPRWIKIAEEVYGYGPANVCIADVRMLNKIEYTLIKAGQKIVDPPLQVMSEGFILPITTSPGSLIYREQGTDPIEPLQTGANLPIGIEQANQKREFIRQAFYADWLRMSKENVEMTAYEVQDRRDEKLRLMAPMLGRQQGELLSPMISRSYELLNNAGKFPQAPASLQKRRLKVEYVSAAARAQSGARATTMGRFMQDILPLAQIAPDILDIVDTDAYAAELAVARGMTRRVLRTQAQLDEIRQAREQAKMIQQAAQIAEPASKAIKNIADANSKAPMTGGMI